MFVIENYNCSTLRETAVFTLPKISATEDVFSISLVARLLVPDNISKLISCPSVADFNANLNLISIRQKCYSV